MPGIRKTITVHGGRSGHEQHDQWKFGEQSWWRYLQRIGTGTALIRHSTIAQNRADADLAGVGRAGGLYVVNGNAQVENSILAGNFQEDGFSDDVFDPMFARFSLIGVSTGGSIFDLGGSLIGSGFSLTTHSARPT